MSDAHNLLKGVRVIECVPQDQPVLVHLAVAFTGRLLCDLGATVIRLQMPQDPLLKVKSSAQEVVGESSIVSTFLNRNKEIRWLDCCNTASLGDEADLLLLTESCAARSDTAQVVVTAAASGVDIEPSALTELAVQGLVGLTDLFGEPDGQPLMMGGHQTAYALGFAAFCASMSGLLPLKRTGTPDVARVNAVEALAWINWKGIAAGTLGFPINRGGRGAEAPVLKCANGHFAFMYLPRNWDDICAHIGDPRLADERFAKASLRARHAEELNAILAEWACSQTWQSLFAFCQRCAIPGGPVLHGLDLLEDPLYRHRSFLTSAQHPVDAQTSEVHVPGLPLTVEQTAIRQAALTKEARPLSDFLPSPVSPQLPLSGKVVVDLGIFTAGSVTSTLLADLGATVIKVESQSYADPFRIWPGIKGDSPLFTFNNRNKLGLELDLKTDAGRARFLDLIEHADVVVENFRRGVLERLGIDYPVLQAANPRIVLASISGQGASGPGCDHVSFGSTLEALGGISSLTGYPDGDCYISGRNLNYPDQIVCLYGAGAVIAALLKADATGQGLHIDVSQREVTSLAIGEQIAAASLSGERQNFPGNGDFNAILQDVFATQDGWICVTINNEEDANRVVERFGHGTEDVLDVLERVLRTYSRSQAILALGEVGINAFAANTGAEAAELSAIKLGAAFAKTPSGQMVKGFPFQFDANPMRIYAESPSMGEQSAFILDCLEEIVRNV